MASRNECWWLEPPFWIEVFVLLNVGFLTFDIYIAHSVNAFRREPEYVPLFFSAIAPLLLVAGLVAWKRWGWEAVWRDVGYLVAFVSIGIGLAGVVFHMDSRFFYDRTLKSLTYAAPFAAPLAYAGLGFLLLVNRMVKSDSVEWAQWIVFFTLGGFFGNFVMSLTDHADNAFYNPAEWIPVISAAVAVGFLLVPLILPVSRRFLDLCAAVLALQVAVGVLGFALHAVHNLHGPSVHPFNNFVYGAPPMAPLLFPNLAVLGWIGLWRYREHLPAHGVERRASEGLM